MTDESTKQRALAWDRVWDLLCLLDDKFPFSQTAQGASTGTESALRAIEEYHRLAVKGITEANAVAERLREWHIKTTADLTKRLGMRKKEVKHLSKALRLSVLERRALQSRYETILHKLAEAHEAQARLVYENGVQDGREEGVLEAARHYEGQ